jgi:hypothetical protein
MDVTWSRESVYADLSAPPPWQTSPDIVRVEAFVVSGICRAESEIISQIVGNQLRKDNARDFGKLVPFFSDISLLLYKSKQEFIGSSPPSTSHLYHSASSSGTRRNSKLISCF